MNNKPQNNAVTTHTKVPIIGFVGYSGSGKTTLLEKVVKHFTSINWQIAVIKHAHHKFDIDHPGKDSYVLRKAGAQQTIIASNTRWALISESTETEKEPNLPLLVSKIDLNKVDILFVEGFKHENYKKIEIHRTTTLDHDFIFPTDPNVIAIASDLVKIANCPIAQLAINNEQEVFDFITHFANNYRHEQETN